MRARISIASRGWRRWPEPCLSPGPAPASAEKRIALVVGNSAYKNITPLDNPSKDASLMAETLGALGFTLVGGRAQLDLDKGAMDIAVQSLAGRSRAPTSRCSITPATACRSRAPIISCRSAPIRRARPTSTSR